MLETPNQVIWALLTYTDWWQPSTASVYSVGGHRKSYASDGLRAGLLETMPEREELSRRMKLIPDRDRRLLYLWYMRQLPVNDIARELRIGRRHCFRLRSATIRAIVDLGDEQYASAS